MSKSVSEIIIDRLLDWNVNTIFGLPGDGINGIMEALQGNQQFSCSDTLATMACGLPYTIAAQIAYPERQCVALVGDGGFTMLMGEF